MFVFLLRFHWLTNNSNPETRERGDMPPPTGDFMERLGFTFTYFLVFIKSMDLFKKAHFSYIHHKPVRI